MRSLFLKTFLWFWLAVILAIAAMAVPNLYSLYTSQAKWEDLASRILQPSARQAAAVFERSGETALIEYLQQLQNDYAVQGFLLQDGREVLGRLFSMERLVGERDIQAVTQFTEPDGGLRKRGSLAAVRVRGPSGNPYTFVLAYHDPERSRAPLIEVPVILLLAGGLFCYLIARHVTSPVYRLRAAAESIAEGHLDTRVAPALGGRRDEIAGLARDFDRMAERIESLLAQQKSLLGDVSHELRSPLSRLNVALSLARRGPAEEVPEHLERIQMESRRLDKLIGQLLMLSRIDSGVHVGDRAEIDLCHLVQEVAGDADFEARASGRRVSVERADACAITGSEEILRSAIENVVRNAVRHTGEGTEVEVALCRESSKAVLRVRDHGPGVPEAMLSEMFLPFRRAESASNGAGLGLAITERAVRAHGGVVRAFNADQGGLVVDLEFPL